MRKLPLLLVEWEDITTDSGWKHEIGDYTNKISRCFSVGWKLKSTRRYLVITPMRDHHSFCDDRQIIPRGCIKSIRRLE